MSAHLSAPLTLPGTLPVPGAEAPGAGGHVRQRRTGTKRSLTTVELTMEERRLLDELAYKGGISRAAVMRDALRVLGEQRGLSLDDFQETPNAA